MNYYISGPMTGITDFNFPAFDLVANALRAEGHEVFSPADHDRAVVTRLWPGKRPEDFAGYAVGDIADYFDAVSSGGEFTLDNMLKADLLFIVGKADGIVMLDGWEKSTGARYERVAAEAVSVPVLFWHDGCLSSDIDQKRLTSFLRGFNA